MRQAGMHVYNELLVAPPRWKEEKGATAPQCFSVCIIVLDSFKCDEKWERTRGGKSYGDTVEYSILRHLLIKTPVLCSNVKL